MISAECGLPAFRPSTTLGFDIETIDYTDEDIGNLRRRRVLTSTDLNRKLEQTNNENFLNMQLENEEIEALSKIIKTQAVTPTRTPTPTRVPAAPRTMTTTTVPRPVPRPPASPLVVERKPLAKPPRNFAV